MYPLVVWKIGAPILGNVITLFFRFLSPRGTACPQLISGCTQHGNMYCSTAPPPPPPPPLSIMKVHLKTFKCDQFGKGANVFIGRSNDFIYPLEACQAYMSKTGYFFRDRESRPLLKPLCPKRKVRAAIGLHQELRKPQFSNWHCIIAIRGLIINYNLPFQP